MLLGVISDTHGHIPNAVFAHLRGCERILHLGDLGPMGLLADLGAVAPVLAVGGNTDPPGRPELPPRRRLTLEGLPLFMRHLPWGPHDPDPDAPALYLHGHTHIPRVDRVGAALILCPGSVSRPRDGKPASLALLDLQKSLIHLTMLRVEDGDVILQQVWPRS